MAHCIVCRTYPRCAVTVTAYTLYRIVSDLINKKQLYWMCRRGTKELDELTLRYLNEHYDQAAPEQRRAFAKMLQLPDPDLHKILIGAQSDGNPLIDEIAKRIRREPLD